MFTDLQIVSLTATTTGASPYSSLILIVAMFAVFYFLLIRPQKKKDKEIKQMRDSLSVGDEVVTIGGIMGKVVKVTDTTVIIELPHGKQRITFSKWAIGTVEKKAKDAKADNEEPAKEGKEVEKLEEKKVEKTEEKTEEKKEDKSEE